MEQWWKIMFFFWGVPPRFEIFTHNTTKSCAQQQQILQSNDQSLQVVEKLFEVDKNANGIHFLQWEHNGISRRLNGYALGFESCWDVMGLVGSVSWDSTKMCGTCFLRGSGMMTNVWRCGAKMANKLVGMLRI